MSMGPDCGGARHLGATPRHPPIAWRAGPVLAATSRDRRAGSSSGGRRRLGDIDARRQADEALALLTDDRCAPPAGHRALRAARLPMRTMRTSAAMIKLSTTSSYPARSSWYSPCPRPGDRQLYCRPTGHIINNGVSKATRILSSLTACMLVVLRRRVAGSWGSSSPRASRWAWT